MPPGDLDLDHDSASDKTSYRRISPSMGSNKLHYNDSIALKFGRQMWRNATKRHTKLQGHRASYIYIVLDPLGICEIVQWHILTNIENASRGRFTIIN